MSPKKSLNYTFNAVLLLLVGLTGMLWLSSCKDDPIEYTVDRVSAFSFKLDTFDLVTTGDVVIYEGPPVLHDFADSTQELFQRVSLQAQGMTPKSVAYWFVVDFDTQLDGDAVGIYRSQYDHEMGGINDMRLILENVGTYVEFRAVKELNAVYFQVEAQDESERIMRGVFGGVLFKDGDPASQAAYITEGAFKDIKY